MSKPGRTPEVTDEEILAVLRESDEPVLTAGEVAEQLPIGRRAIHDRLVDLRERGLVERKNVGPRAVWWIPHVPEDDGGSLPAEGDPLFDLPTFSGGDPTDVSENVDEHLAAAIGGDPEDSDEA